MKKKASQLKQYLQQARVVEPNDLGFPFLTYPYRKIIIFFKTAPFIFVVPLSFVGATLIVYIFGLLAVQLVSLLQYGF